MTKTFTKNDLIRLLYNETTLSERKAIEGDLCSNLDFNNQYLELKESKNELDSALMAPSERAVKNILNYACSYATNN